MDVVSTQRRMAPRPRRTEEHTEHDSSIDNSSPPPPPSSKDGPFRKIRQLHRSRAAARSSSAPARLRHGRGLKIADHYRVDPVGGELLPGVPVHNDDWARDTHDFFNLIVLVPVVVLNAINWNWDMIFHLSSTSKHTLIDAWTGEHFHLFWDITLLYFIVDLIWVLLVPHCVKSPSTIIQHHIATICYIFVPFVFKESQWVMGACMSVEVNTWFLIARRVFNKQGFPPWQIELPPFISLRIKLISIFFYVTWFGIRVFLYPYLFFPIFGLWQWLSEESGTVYNVMLVCMPLHTVFCILNLKWTWDLLSSKVKSWRKGEKGKVDKGL